MRRDTHRGRPDIKPYSDLSDFKDIHVGRRCFVVGAGPTLALQDISSLRNDVVITVNSSILLLDWSVGESTDRYWISNDTLCLQWDYFWQKVLQGCCQKIVRTSWKEHADKVMKHNFRFFKPRPTPVVSPLSNDGQALCSVSSIPTAVDFALLTGCNEIYLLGVDHKILYGNSHFWQFWPKDKWPQRKSKGKNFRPEQSHQVRKFDENIQSYEVLKELGDRVGAKIYNCSNPSIIDVFEKKKLSEVIT